MIQAYNRLLCSKFRTMSEKLCWQNGVNGANLFGREAAEVDADAPNVPYARAVIIPIGLH